MLRATRRLLRPGGRTAFTVIHLSPGLSPDERRRAIDSGPPAVATRSPSYEQLLTSAGFRDIETVDLTRRFFGHLETWLRQARDHEDELVAAEPDFGEVIAERMLTRGAVADGLLRRSLFVARHAS